MEAARRLGPSRPYLNLDSHHPQQPSRDLPVRGAIAIAIPGPSPGTAGAHQQEEEGQPGHDPGGIQSGEGREGKEHKGESVTNEAPSGV